jgi:hypothetical protein
LQRPLKLLLQVRADAAARLQKTKERRAQVATEGRALWDASQNRWVEGAGRKPTELEQQFVKMKSEQMNL